MPNPASISDVVLRWRPLTEQEAATATAFLDDAWALLTARRPSLEADLTAGTVSHANAVRVVSAMVLRLLKNPEGKLEESIDDYRYRRDSALSSGELYVTDDELADLTPGRPSGGVRSVRLVTPGGV